VSAEARSVVEVYYAAYASGDAPALVATLDDDFICGPLNGAPWLQGKAAATPMYAAHFVDYPLSLTEHLGECAVGSCVIRQERSRSATGKPEVSALAIHTVQDGVMTRLDMVNGAPGDVSVIQAQLDAYNIQDLDAHCACFADDVVVADLNGAENLHGIAAYRERYRGVFAQFPQNKVELLARLSAGDVVMDHEKVMRSPEGPTFEVLAIYTLRDGKIARVDFVK
jgi:hypothetical protein